MATRHVFQSVKRVVTPLNITRSFRVTLSKPDCLAQSKSGLARPAARAVTTMATKASVEGAPYEPEKLPTITASSGDVKTWKGDMLALAICEDALSVTDDAVSIANDDLAALNSSLSDIVQEVLDAGDFKGKKGNTATLRVGAEGVRYVTLVGIGKSADLTPNNFGPSALQSAGAAMAAAFKANKTKTAAVATVGLANGDAETVAQEIAYGVLTGAYESTRFKSEAKPSPLESMKIFASDGAETAISRGISLAKANLYARWLVEAPPNVCNPTYLAGAAKAIAEKFPDNMSCTILEQADCEKMGMGCYLGVSECSAHPPRFIHLTYKPKGDVKRKVAIVGKGLTFDSGGYNLKAGPGSMIELMKLDMGGAAATFGAARAIAELAPEGVEVHFISASCENLIDGKGLFPGNVLVSASGKTVEVGNTDAEGRLTLIDALWYAQEKVGAERCIDIATLTGAQMIALGNGIGAVMTPSEALATEIPDCGKGVGGERWWRLPLEDAYFELLKSKCADVNNIGGRLAGCITAGLFLQHFIDKEKMEWAHLDIAGPAWDDKLGGATGFGAATLAKWASSQGS